MEMLVTTFNQGDRVRIKGERNTTYVIHRLEGCTVLLYGGNVDPNKLQRWRTVASEKIVADKRKQIGRNAEV